MHPPLKQATSASDDDIFLWDSIFLYRPARAAIGKIKYIYVYYCESIALDNTLARRQEARKRSVPFRERLKGQLVHEVTRAPLRFTCVRYVVVRINIFQFAYMCMYIHFIYITTLYIGE